MERKEGGFYSKLLHLPTQVVCRQWLKMKYSFVRSANHALQKNVISKARTPIPIRIQRAWNSKIIGKNYKISLLQH